MSEQIEEVVLDRWSSSLKRNAIRGGTRTWVIRRTKSKQWREFETNFVHLLGRLCHPDATTRIPMNDNDPLAWESNMVEAKHQFWHWLVMSAFTQFVNILYRASCNIGIFCSRVQRCQWCDASERKLALCKLQSTLWAGTGFIFFPVGAGRRVDEVRIWIANLFTGTGSEGEL